MKTLYLTIFLNLLTFPCIAKSLDVLSQTLSEAYEEADFEKYKKCFYDKGVTEDVWNNHLGQFTRKTTLKDNQKLKCKIEVSSDISDSAHVAYGKKYYPNHQPDGSLKVIFNDGSSVSFDYAEIDGKYFTILLIVKDLNWQGERDKWISFSTTPKLDWGEIGKPATYKIKIYYNASGVDLETSSSGGIGMVGQYISKIELIEPLQEDVEVTLNVMEKSIDDQKEVATVKALKGTKILYKK